MIRIIVADRDRHYQVSVSKSFSNDSDIQIEGYVNDGKKLLDLFKQKKAIPDIVLFDLSLKKGLAYDISYVIYLNQHFPQTKFIVQSVQKEGSLIHRMYLNGIPGYLFKDCSEQELKKAILTVQRGETYYQSEARTLMDNFVLHSTNKSDNIIFLTTSEKQLLKRMHASLSESSFSGEMRFHGMRETANWENICIKFGSQDFHTILKEAFAKGLIKLP